MHPTSHPRASSRALLAAGILGFCASAIPTALAQASATDEATSTVKQQAVQLTPFEVQEDSDKSYGALNSNSITQFNTALNKLPISADIFDETFMNDVGVTGGLEQMIETYSAGAGFSQSDPASSSSSNQPLDRNGNSYIQLRGLATPTMQRDGFMMAGTFLNPGSTGVGFSSAFDVERVEIINGPQALLYGAGGGGGVINTVSKQARLGHPAFGSAQYTIDQYGDKSAELDYGFGTDKMALRLALLQQSVGGRRTHIGGPLEGYYGQVAFKLLGNTTVRIEMEDTTFDRENQQSLTLAAASTSNDARNGQSLHYLLATNQINQAANGGASGAGVIDNGFINWANIDSYVGDQAYELTVNRYDSLIVDSAWTSWLSTRLSIAYDDYFDDRINNTISFYAPNNTSNPLGVWAIGETGGSPMSDTTEPSRTKGIRFAALLTNDLFGGRAHSTTSLGVDSQRGDQDQITYEYYLADSNFSAISGGPASINGGHTIITATANNLYWPVNNGPVQYPLWEVAMQNKVTYNGANLVRLIQNPPNPALITPADPQGVAGTSGHYIQQKIFNRGIYGANYTDWWGGKLSSILGFRYGYAAELTYQEGSNPYLISSANALSLNAGLNFALTSWIRPYISISDSINPPLVQGDDPYGQQPKTARALGEEVGIKVQNPSGTISGSLALYKTNSKNEILQISSTLQSDINPSGLNGAFGGSPGSTINVDRTSEGIQLTLTALPTPNWRMRLSAGAINGKIGTTLTYAQLYNDQFNENSAGDLTYADGNIVYVNPTFNSKSLTVPAATAGAVPLTVALLNSSSSAYYANPVAITGQINSSSNGAKVLIGATDPDNPAASSRILTGKTGLPISSIQINPGFTPPGVIPVTIAGDVTQGYPELSAVFTNMYTFHDGWAKGFRVGGTVNLAWKRRQFYYYTNGINITGSRTLFYSPDINQEDVILGYSHKFNKITWSTQLNISNIFNRYQVELLPSPISGWAGPNNATFSAQPRGYTWSNTISF